MDSGLAKRAFKYATVAAAFVSEQDRNAVEVCCPDRGSGGERMIGRGDYREGFIGQVCDREADG